MAVLPVGIGSEEAAGGYQIERSLRFNSADTAYLSRTFGAGNQKTWTLSVWVKRSALGDNQIFSNYTSGSDVAWIYFNSSNELYFQNYEGSNQLELKTTQVFRDVGAWGHLVVTLDTTQATSSNRAKLYWNGVQITTLTTATYPSQNADLKINTNGEAHEIGKGSSTYFNGYLTEINFIDGSALDPTSFGEFNSDTGVWQPKAYTGSYGTNGFYLDFADNSGTTSTTLGADSSGNGNNWTPNNFSVTAGAGNDSLVDSPTRYGTDTGAGGEVRGNYCTLNPLGNATLSGMTFSDGNLTVTTSSARQHILGTMPLPTTGKWYWEINRGNATTGYQAAGIALLNTKITSSPSYNYPYNVWGYADLGYKIENGVQTTGYTTSASTSDVWGFAFDADAGTLGCYLNNTLLFTILSLTGQYIPYLGTETGCTPSINFGQRPWEETCPSGFKALCTTNLLEADSPTIADGSQHFDVALWTGNGSTQSVTTLSFQPDLVWAKSRSLATQHALVDVVRNYYQLSSSLTDAEKTTVTGFDSIRSDGFNLNYTVGGDRDWWNANTYTYVAWNWKAGGSGVNNTAGSISSTVSANTTSGFSIVRWTGTGGSGTLGHGLGVAPEFVVYKRTSAGGDSWVVYHKGITNSQNGGIYLNLTNAWNSDSTLWNNTAPTTSVFSVGNYGNGSGETRVAYCFAPVAGFSRLGSYVGNGSADGPFVFTGFRPRYLVWKRTNSTGSWGIYDTERSTYNPARAGLLIENAGAEFTYDAFDILSNGFKVRAAGAGTNGNGDTHIYIAFAENPFAYSLAR